MKASEYRQLMAGGRPALEDMGLGVAYVTLRGPMRRFSSARCEFPDDLTILDYDEHGNLIGIEALGTAADELARAVRPAG